MGDMDLLFQQKSPQRIPIKGHNVVHMTRGGTEN